MLLELPEREARLNRHAVAHYVQIALREIEDLSTVAALDVGISDVPLARDRPIERRGAARHLVNVEIDVHAEVVQSRAHAVTGNAAANRIDFPSQRVNLIADVMRRECVADGNRW